MTIFIVLLSNLRDTVPIFDLRSSPVTAAGVIGTRVKAIN